jgi:hypothetical protein
MNGWAAGLTYDLLGEEIENYGQIAPAFSGSDIGDSRYPDLIRLRNINVSLDQIWDELSWLGSNIATRFVSRLRSHSISAYQPSAPMFATAFFGLSYIQEHARRAVHALTLLKRCSD